MTCHSGRWLQRKKPYSCRDWSLGTILHCEENGYGFWFFLFPVVAGELVHLILIVIQVVCRVVSLSISLRVFDGRLQQQSIWTLVQHISIAMYTICISVFCLDNAASNSIQYQTNDLNMKRNYIAFFALTFVLVFSGHSNADVSLASPFGLSLIHISEPTRPY